MEVSVGLNELNEQMKIYTEPWRASVVAARRPCSHEYGMGQGYQVPRREQSLAAVDEIALRPASAAFPQ